MLNLAEQTALSLVDVATLQLYQQMLASPRHSPFIAAVNAQMAAPQPVGVPADLRLVIVPGAFYQYLPRSGADGHLVKRQARRQGWPIDTLPTDGTGSVIGNARIICDWLKAQTGSRLVLVSVSKGSADLKLALRQADAGRAFERVVAWVNLCGMLDGTPLIDWLLSWNIEAAFNRLYLQMKGASFDFVNDLRREPGGVLDSALALPPHLSLISLVGFPQRQHIPTGTGRRCHDRLASYGPNDGVLLLNDVCALPGRLYPIWGADHLLRGQAPIEPILAAVLACLARELAA